MCGESSLTPELILFQVEQMFEEEIHIEQKCFDGEFEVVVVENEEYRGSKPQTRKDCLLK